MDIRNPIFTADGRIDCEIDHPAHGWIPFTADPNDVEQHGRDIYAAALDMGPAEYVAPVIPEPDYAAIARAQRNAMLAACDWTQLADAPVDDLAWATYRQALRDIPDQAGFPASVEWPVAPS
jgi:hypothetical protein